MSMQNSLHYCQTCQLQFKERYLKRHARSIFHRKAKLIRAMLERNCITQAEIARRVGLTRERVRQMALMMGFADGRSRHAICRMERRRKAMADFFVAAEQRGFLAEPLSRKSGYINGKLCIQRQACWHDVGNGKHTYAMLSIHRPKVRFDICAWQLPDDRFLILPRKLVNFVQTSFNPEKTEKPGTNSASHYYRDYIERWSLLGRARQPK